MEHLILGLLILKEMTLYELNTSFKKGLSLIYSASYGSLQTAVKKLLKSEYVYFEEAVSNGRNKKIYHINEKGIEAFFNWMHSEIPEKKLETVLLSKIYFLGLIESKEERLSIIDHMIQKTKSVESDLKFYQEQLDELDIPDEHMDIAKFQLKTLDFGVSSHTHALEWLEKMRDDLSCS